MPPAVKRHAPRTNEEEALGAFGAGFFIDGLGRVVLPDAPIRATIRDQKNAVTAMMTLLSDGAVRELRVRLIRTSNLHPRLRVSTVTVQSDAIPPRLVRTPSPNPWGLTKRELSVLDLLLQGARNKEIATRLGCAVRTVEHHVTALLEKSGAESRTELLALVLRAG